MENVLAVEQTGVVAFAAVDPVLEADLTWLSLLMRLIVETRIGDNEYIARCRRLHTHLTGVVLPLTSYELQCGLGERSCQEGAAGRLGLAGGLS